MCIRDRLHNVKGKVAISGYHSELMDKLYSDWRCIESNPKKAHSTNTRADTVKQERVEVLWVNYALPTSPEQDTPECQIQQTSLMPLFKEPL